MGQIWRRDGGVKDQRTFAAVSTTARVLATARLELISIGLQAISSLAPNYQLVLLGATHACLLDLSTFLPFTLLPFSLPPLPFLVASDVSG